MKYLSAEEAAELGVLLEVNRLLLHPRGLALEAMRGSRDPRAFRIQDHRDDPEGVIFGDDGDELERLEKSLRFAKLVLWARQSRFGFVVQPLCRSSRSAS